MVEFCVLMFWWLERSITMYKLKQFFLITKKRVSIPETLFSMAEIFKLLFCKVFVVTVCIEGFNRFAELELNRKSIGAFYR